jgi:glycosyltransferase involved in cell wall biosynthesis
MQAEPSAALTIAIPFYQGHVYLREAIDSVLQQKHQEWQLLICDDGPATGTEELVRSYADPRLRYHRNVYNLGMAGNWNQCLDLATTDLVSLLHADDRLLPNYAGLMTAAAARDPAAAAFFCRSVIIDAAGEPCFSLADFVKRLLEPGRGVLRLEGGAALAALLRGNFIMCPTVCYRKSVLAQRRFAADWKQVHDLELYARLLLDGEHLIGLPEVAYAYRRHAGNATAQQTRDLSRFREEAALYDRLAALAAARGWTQAARVGRAKRIIALHLLYQGLRALLHVRLSDARRVLALLGEVCC